MFEYFGLWVIKSQEYIKSFELIKLFEKLEPLQIVRRTLSYFPHFNYRAGTKTWNNWHNVQYYFTYIMCIIVSRPLSILYQLVQWYFKGTAQKIPRTTCAEDIPVQEFPHIISCVCAVWKNWATHYWKHVSILQFLITGVGKNLRLARSKAWMWWASFSLCFLTQRDQFVWLKQRLQ